MNKTKLIYLILITLIILLFILYVIVFVTGSFSFVPKCNVGEKASDEYIEYLSNEYYLLFKKIKPTKVFDIELEYNCYILKSKNEPNIYLYKVIRYSLGNGKRQAPVLVKEGKINNPEELTNDLSYCITNSYVTSTFFNGPISSTKEAAVFLFK